MNNARDTSAMDTLPLNGNFNNSYSLRNGDYGDSVQVVDCGLGLDDAAFEKMIISELVHNNLRACGKSHRSESRINTKKVAGADVGSQDDIIVAETSSLVHLGTETNHIVGGLSLHPHHHHTHNPHHPRELEAPLIPQRTHSLLYHTQERARTEPAAPLPPHSYATQLPAQPQAQDSLQSPNRDSLYASLPNLRDSPSAESGPDTLEDLSPSKQSESEDVYYKSMPNLGASSQQLHAYYQISRGSSDGYIIPITKEGCIPEGDVREGQMQLVTSL